MLKRELKVNLKSFIIWTILVVLLYLLVFAIYPSISSNENIKMIDEMVKIFPPEVIKAFNMDIASIETAFGWLKTEGFIFVLLITGCYSAILGSSILLKEESEKTIEYLNSLPVTRNKIVTNKIIVSIFYIILMILIIGISNYIGLKFNGDINNKEFILLSITPIFPALVIFSICIFLSTFTNKTKKTLGISLGIVFISYILQMVSTISEEIEFLKYASVFTLADVRNVITKVEINPNIIIITTIMTIIFLGLTYLRYNKKELV